MPDPNHIITAGQDKKPARTMACQEHDRIPVEALTIMPCEIDATNRAGGWGRLQGR